jgi:PPK2 family polyphosphate:nucleotide phosphotransferase
MMSVTQRYALAPDASVRLGGIDPEDTGGQTEAEASQEFERCAVRIAELQDVLYAQSERAVLIILQSMDTGGKDPAIREVMYRVNPQGCQVRAFKKASKEEAEHDFLWRFHRWTPGRGMIGVFNRSYYEDVLGTRVHREISNQDCTRRYEDINTFERMLAREGTRILKFFFHISKDEQKRRLRKRMENPDKQWELSEKDFSERKLWDEYMRAYEDAISATSTEWAPWHVLPADRDWFRNWAVAHIIVEALESLDLKYPPPEVDLNRVTLD